MITIQFTKEQWRTVFEAYIRQYNNARKKYEDEIKYIESIKDTERWTEDAEHKYWHMKQLNSAKIKMDTCKGIIETLEHGLGQEDD